MVTEKFSITTFILTNFLNGLLGLFFLGVAVGLILLGIAYFNKSTPKFKIMEIIREKDNETGIAIIYAVAIVISALLLSLSHIISTAAY